MRRLFLFILIIVLLPSCPIENDEFIDALFNKDRIPPVLNDYELIENRICHLKFSENVMITEAKIADMNVNAPSSYLKSLNLEFDKPIESGKEETLFITAEDKSGNTSRYALRLSGINLNQAELLITELSVKGTEQSPDRIELTCTKSGSLLGYALTDAILGYESFRYYMPDIYLYKNDIIVIYWDRCDSLENTLFRDSEKTYYLFAKAPETLISTNGSVVLYNHTNGKGKIEDAVLYNSSDAVNNNGYGNKKSEESAKYIISIEQWNGESVKSDQITSSRTLARYYPYEDSNSADDFYITKARNSTFGYPNTNVKYEPL